MLPPTLDDRLTALIDDLLREDCVETALLASILLTAQEAIKDGSVATLSLQVWKAHRSLHDEPADSQNPQRRAAVVPARELSPVAGGTQSKVPRSTTSATEK